MKQLLLILNPTAGMKKASRALPEIVSVFNRAGYDAHVYVTAGQGDATAAVERLGAGMDLVVCCGGDGTLNETATGLLHAGLDVPVGYIPSGSTNDFAGSLHLSGQVVKAAQQIVEGTEQALDLGRFNDRYFTYVASFGAFTKTSYSTPQNVKNALGHLAYVLEGIQELTALHAERIRIEIGEETLEEEYLFGAVCNSTSVGGVLTLDPGLVDMSDGLFEVLLVRAPQNLQALHECIQALRNQTYNCEMITFRSASSVRIFSPKHISWSLDGEWADGSEEILIENLPRRIRLVH